MIGRLFCSVQVCYASFTVGTDVLMTSTWLRMLPSATRDQHTPVAPWPADGSINEKSSVADVVS